MMHPPITILMNNGSGSSRGNAVHDEIIQAFAGHHCTPAIIDINAIPDFSETSAALFQKAKEKNGIIVAAGGDGTVNAVATQCVTHGVTLGVIPLGTFNYFAREMLIPLDVAEAVRIILQGRTVKASVGKIQDRLFLNNASFGLYTNIIRQRENATYRFGRLRIVAALSAVMSLIKGHRLFNIRISSDGAQPSHHRASMVFIGNNTLQLNNLGLDVAACTRRNKLAVVILKEAGAFATARLIWRGIIKHWQDETILETFCADAFDVDTKRTSIDLVIDGEIIHCHTPLSFHVETEALSVRVPTAQEGMP